MRHSFPSSCHHYWEHCTSHSITRADYSCLLSFFYQWSQGFHGKGSVLLIGSGSLNSINVLNAHLTMCIKRTPYSTLSCKEKRGLWKNWGEAGQFQFLLLWKKILHQFSFAKQKNMKTTVFWFPFLQRTSIKKLQRKHISSIKEAHI